MAVAVPAPSASRGNVFISNTAVAGVLIPVSSTTSPTFGLWNKAGSTKYARLISIKFGFHDTTGAAGNLMYNLLTGAGSAIGTGLPLSAFTASTTVLNGLLGSTNTPALTPSATATVAGTNTLTTAAAIYATSGISQLVTTAATTGATGWTMVDRFDDTHYVPPGCFWYVTGSAAWLSLTDITLTWDEWAL